MSDLLRPEPITDKNIQEVQAWILESRGPRFPFPQWRGFIFRLEGKIVGMMVNGNHTLFKSHIDPAVDPRHSVYMHRFGTDWARTGFPSGFMLCSRNSPLLDVSLKHGWTDVSESVAFLGLSGNV